MQNHSTVKARRLRKGGTLAAGVLLLAMVVPLPASGAWGSARVAAANAAAPPGWVTTNTRVGANNKNPVRLTDIPGVATDPADPRHLVLVDENFGTGQCEFHVSFDGGASWTGGNLAPPAGWFSNPPCQGLDSSGYPHMNQSVAFGSNGQVYVSFDSSNGPLEVYTNKTNMHGQAAGTLVAKSSDGGRTFAPAVVAIPAPPGPEPWYVRSRLGVQSRPTGDRVVVAAWGVNITKGGPADGMGDRQLVTAVSNDGGATFAAPVVASAPGEQIREPSAPVFGSDGAIYEAYTSRTGGVGHYIGVVKSVDGGATWVEYQAGAVTGDGQGDAGGAPSLGIDPSGGTLYLTYMANQQYNDQDIYFQRSTDQAKTWSAPLRVNDDPTGNGVAQVLPHLAVAPNGRIDIVWLDARNAYQEPASLMASGEADIYYASSSDGGATFSANRRISDRSINMDMGLLNSLGSYAWYGPVLADRGNNDVFFAWSDPRDGNTSDLSNDIVTATLHLGAAAGDQLNAHQLTATSATLAIQVSQQAYPGGSEQVAEPAVGTRVVLVNEADATDALVGAALARSYYGPVLVTPANSLPKTVKDELARLQPAGVFVLGDDQQISAAVLDAVKAVVPNNVTRLGTPDQVATAVAVAQAMDLRSADDKTSGKPAFSGAVVVNPASPDAVAAAGYAAQLRYPVLFSGRDAVPAATTAAIQSLKIPSVVVVGGTDAVTDAAMSALPKATRIGGSDVTSTSAAIAADAVTRGMDTNVVFVAPASKPVDVGVMGAATARDGGLLVVAKNPTTKDVAATLGRLHLQPDQVWVATPSKKTATPWALIVAFVVLGLVGAVLLVIVYSRTRSTPRAATAGGQ